MTVFQFTGGLSEEVVDDVELDAMFSDLETFLNAPSMSAGNIEPGAIDYRHIKHQPRFGLAQFDRVGPPTFTKGPFSGYYPVDETVLQHTSSVQHMDNEVKTAQGVVHVSAWLGIADQVNNITPISDACIGYSTDNGATYTPLINGTGRPFGDKCNGSYAGFFDGPSLQPHYYSGAAGYSPPNSVHDHFTILVASFGGEKSLGDPTSITHYAVMVDSTTVGNSQPFWWIEMNARDTVI